MKPVLVMVALSAAAFGMLATPAQAGTCYTVDYDPPTVQLTPPAIRPSDSNPEVRAYPC